MCEIVNIIDGIQSVLDNEILMLQSADCTEGDFQNKIQLMYSIDNRRAHLLRARMFSNSADKAEQ